VERALPLQLRGIAHEEHGFVAGLEQRSGHVTPMNLVAPVSVSRMASPPMRAALGLCT
jgi:hypothetical protein